jgi:hypothetical protein
MYSGVPIFSISHLEFTGTSVGKVVDASEIVRQLKGLTRSQYGKVSRIVVLDSVLGRAV